MVFGFGKRRREAALGEPFPPAWRQVLTRRWALWSRLDEDEQRRLEPLIQAFVYDTRWEAANQFEITDAMQVLIAAQACLLVLELGDDDNDPLDYYRAVSTIIVHPRPVVLHGQRSTATGGVMTDAPTRIDGQAHYEGPVILAWNAVSIDARNPRRGLNVVYHEFAHKLDMLDGVVDGTPPLLGEQDRERWIEVCTREYRAIRAGTDDGFLRAYGGTDPGEFFAVATEMFFSRPVEMRAARSDLYDLMVRVFRQDPALRHPEPADVEVS